MSLWNSEEEARETIKDLVIRYYHDFKEASEEFKPGRRISYASRVLMKRNVCFDRCDAGFLADLRQIYPAV